MTISRRGLLGIPLSPAVAEALQHAHQAAAQPNAAVTYLNEADAREIEALASTILPSTDGPGAREAGAIHFIGRALATFDAGQRDLYRDGLADAQRRRLGLFPDSTSIASLEAVQQEQLMRALEPTPFFEALRRHTVFAFLGSPAHGGNRDRAGWAYIGFEDQMIFMPPFGHYDAETSA